MTGGGQRPLWIEREAFRPLWARHGVYRIENADTGERVDLVVGAPHPPGVGQTIFGHYKVVAVEDRVVRVRAVGKDKS